MKSTLNIALKIIFLIILAVGCTYEPTGVYESGAKPNPTPPVLKVSLNMIQDTLLVMRNQKLEFYFVSDSNKIIKGEIKIEGYGNFSGKVDSSGLIIRFSINTSDIEKKFSDATVTITTSSNSGSLADKLNTEGFVLTRKWVLRLFDFRDYWCKINGAELSGGSLLLHWSTNAFAGMVDSVQIQKYTGKGSVWVRKFIGLPDEFDLSDNTYLGERAVYRLFMYLSYGGYNSSTASEFVTFESIRSPLNHEITGKKIKFSWTKPPLDKNIAGWTISINGKELWSGSFGDTTATIDEYYFATSREYFLNPVPAIQFPEYAKNVENEDYASSARIYCGEKSPFSFGSIYPTNSEKIMYRDNNLLKFFSVAEGKVLEEYPTYGYGTFLVSNDGGTVIAPDLTNYVIGIIKSKVSLPKQTYKLDLLQSSFSGFSFALTDDAKLLIGNRYKADIYIYDLATDRLSASFKVPGWTSELFVTPDGRRFACDFDGNFAIYGINGNRLDTLYKSQGQFIGFADNRYAAVELPQKAQVLDMDSYCSAKYDKDLHGDVKSVDISGPNILLQEDGSLEAVNFLTGDIYYTVRSYFDKFTLHYNIIYASNGLIERIK